MWFLYAMTLMCLQSEYYGGCSLSQGTRHEATDMRMFSTEAECSSAAAILNQLDPDAHAHCVKKRQLISCVDYICGGK